MYLHIYFEKSVCWEKSLRKIFWEKRLLGKKDFGKNGLGVMGHNLDCTYKRATENI